MNTICRTVLLALAGLLAAGGCQSGSPNQPVNAARAREVLRAALDSWKNGDAVTTLQSASPPIYVIDPEWQAGTKLVGYEVLGDGEEKDAQLFALVRLTVRGPGGKEATQTVTYMVSTAPNLTVGRKIF